MITVASMWRHPIKSHGREALAFVDLVAGQSMPWDRRWAVTHADHKFSVELPQWVMCRNFLTGTRTPQLMAIWATLDEASSAITLRHPDLAELTFSPDVAEDVARFLEWVAPLCPSDGRTPTGIVSLPDRGLTDSDYPSVSILNAASHAEVSAQSGRKLEAERWRGNICLDGMPAWQEWGLIGNDIKIGDAILRVKEPIARCMLPAANPKTGERDIDILAVLRDNWDHQNFGINAEVIRGGKISLGDTAEVL